MMIKRIAIALCFLIASQAQGAGPDECGIWLCLPLGFAVDGCSKPRKAMYKRILKFKSHAPAFYKCLAPSSPSSTNYDMQVLSLQDVTEIKVFQDGHQTGFTYYSVGGLEYVVNPVTGAAYFIDEIPPEALEGLF